MTLSIFKKTLEQGPKSQFLMQKPGFKLLPLQYNYQGIFTVKPENNHSSLKIHFSIYFNFDEYISFHFDIDYQKRMMDSKEVIDGEVIPRLRISSEVFYEYGNEEEHLPSLDTYKIFYTEKEMLDLITTQINEFEKSDNFKLFSELSQKFNIEYQKIKDSAIQNLTNVNDTQEEEDVFYMKRILNHFTINEQLETELNKP